METEESRDLEAEKKALRAEAASLEGAEVKSKKPDKVTLVSVSNVEEEEINWLYPPYVPRGKITLCAAYPGTGNLLVVLYGGVCIDWKKLFQPDTVQGRAGQSNLSYLRGWHRGHDQETSEDMRSKYRQRFYSARRTEQPFI